MLNGKIVKINNRFTKGHYAIQAHTAGRAFTNPMGACEVIKLKKSDIVVDIGAYVGEYSLYASRFAQKVIAYEASPYTFQVLKMNKTANMEIHHKAVVGDNRKEATLYLSRGIGATNSLVKKKNKSVIVPAINYNEVIKEATVVKIDVEGGEYDYDIIHPNLRAIILEFHPIGDKWVAAYKIMDQLKRRGFKAAFPEPQFQNGWDTNSAWIR